MRLSQMEDAEEMAIISSRIYLVLLTLSIVVLMLFNGLTYTTVSVTIPSPAMIAYDDLHAQYGSTLNCPCKQMDISYGIFLSIMVTYHQVCSSDFISSTWTTNLYGYGSDADIYLRLDRPLLSKQHQIMGSLCKISQSIVNQTVSNYEATKLINSLVITRDLLASYVNVSMDQLIKETPLDFRRLNFATRVLLAVNLIPSAFNTDWSFEYGNASNDYVLRNIPIIYSNDTCNCAVSSECQAPLRIGTPDLVLPGLVAGCFPMDGLRMSTLECFFSSNCINTILGYLEHNTVPEQSKSLDSSFSEILPSTLKPLNVSMPSRFSLVTPISTIIDELFIEKWEYVMSYEAYYNTCAPTTCNYKYSQRRSALYVITSLLSLYGGLTVSLRFIVWHCMVLYKTTKSIRRIQHVTVVSQNTIS